MFLSADAVRHGDADLAAAVPDAGTGISGAVAGVAAARRPGRAAKRCARTSTTSWLIGRALPALIVSVVSRDRAALVLVYRRRYEPARYTAALAVAAVIAGWALAQAPDLLPGLTIDQAAAPRDTLIALTIARDRRRHHPVPVAGRAFSPDAGR